MQTVIESCFNRLMDELIGIYKRAFEIVKNNKVLWIFGMALVAFAGGGGSNFSSFRSFGNSFDSSKAANLPKITGTPSALKETFPADSVFTYFKDLFASLPVSFYLIFALTVVALLVVGLVISIIVGSWARGAAIGAINDGYDRKEVTLKGGSDYAVKGLRQMIWVTLITWLLYFVDFMIMAVIAAVMIFLIASFKGSLFIIFPILIMTVSVFAGILVMLCVSASQIWAERLIIIENITAWQALKQGWVMVRKYILNMLLLGSGNCVIGCFIGGCLGFAMLGVLFMLLIPVILSVIVNKNLIFIWIFPLIILMIIVGILNMAINGIIRIFNYTTWNVLYRQLKEKEANG